MKKIMIVDDEQVSLMMTENILSTQYKTVCASSGKEAIEVYHREHPDMVLSDLRMPGMSGYELQQNLQRETGLSIPFMFMTADRDDETESKGFENGALDFIRKPFRADVLIRRVGNILQTVETIQGLQRAVDTDPMTGLLNKASAQEEIGILCQKTQGTLMMIDLDSFKLVNDIYGHAMGDRILIRFADIIRSVVRSTDITGRMGGDEFIAFCEQVRDEQVIAKKARDINEQILASAKEFMGEDMSIPLGASLGCVFVPDEGTDFQDLFQKADKALYVVKQNGKHGFSIYSAHTHEKKGETSSETDLPHVHQILGERNQAEGAFVLPLENFRIVYQFLKRSSASYKKATRILLFSLEKKREDAFSSEETSELFLSVLRSSLRQSDVVTQSSQNQFIVLLQEMTAVSTSLVVSRIQKNWQKMETESGYGISYEWDSLEAAAGAKTT